MVVYSAYQRLHGLVFGYTAVNRSVYAASVFLELTMDTVHLKR